MTTSDPKTRSPSRLRVLTAARLCFARDGFHGASMKSICKACDMSPGTLYHHFASKEALIEEIIQQDQQRAFSRFDDSDQQRDVVEEMIANLLAVREEDQAQRSLVIEIMAEGMRNPLVAAMLERKHQAIMQRVIERLEKGKAQGAIAAHIDVNAAASLLLSLTYGVLADTGSAVQLSEQQRRKTLTAMINGLLGINP
ncbi:TetR/AcrR family transcriptional regulator [Erwiniaceae bacterium BAC15a-03b]|uniref:TetR/AcrR family transcriptional regulator n=1 Tax=Winslowiella arboricola TaxID=2978220 RepID=A0A9J6PDW5_9GAMM|nr:TetR/AcrR family transcriptional regulator [Winslowiella arboricola]MCU5771644.1 TetR/AcrR family transcriptional regulator [Winslowiella arboricola]MCU5776457.1 TetR/AcrR family transcriptional regulator [Winslowiella arboricola]